MHGRRSERVAEQLRLELAELIENEVADPRVGAVTVTRVEVSGDGKQARVFVAPLDAEVDEKQLVRGLDHARPYLRRELAARLQLRYTPDLGFSIDRGPQHAERVETLLEGIKKP